LRNKVLTDWTTLCRIKSKERSIIVERLKYNNRDEKCCIFSLNVNVLNK
jgi:hypothetical protein